MSSLSALKDSVSRDSDIPVPDLILLIGPPFKSLDSQFGPELLRPDTKVYLYNRQGYADVNLPPLGPQEVAGPEQPGNLPSSISYLRSASSPLMRTLPDFGSLIVSQYRRGIALYTYVKESIKSAKKSAEQSTVQAAALAAAVDNLRYHYDLMKKSYQSNVEKLQVLLGYNLALK